MDRHVRSFELTLPIEIRKCAEADLPLLEWDGLFTPHRAIIEEAFERQERGENLMLVAEFNSFPIGQIWIDLKRRRSAQAGYLWALRVQTPFQRLSIGKKLIAAAEAELIWRDYPAAELGVELSNKRALNLYQQLQYKVTGLFTEMNDYTTPEGVHHRWETKQWRMRKALNTRSDRNPELAEPAGEHLTELCE